VLSEALNERVIIAENGGRRKISKRQAIIKQIAAGAAATKSGNRGNVTRPRAADDFASIRARIEELRRERVPRAADDFAAIRVGMEELRRERAQARAIRRKAGQAETGRGCRLPARIGLDACVT
jgi:hypothetical protein